MSYDVYIEADTGADEHVRDAHPMHDPDLGVKGER